MSLLSLVLGLGVASENPGAIGAGEPPDPHFTARPVISGTPAIGEYLTLVSAGTAEGTPPINITGEWLIDGVVTGVTVTVIEVAREGNYRWKSVATNGLGETVASLSNSILVSLSVDPDGFGLPAVFLTVADPGAINALTKTPATIQIANNFGSTLTDAQRLVGQEKIDLKWAGNSTGQANKKAYNMTTLTAPDGSNNDVPLLGMAAGRDWRLLANAYDLTDLKTYFCLGIGQSIDLPWTPHGRPCELFLNGVYQGTYFLAERVKRHANRLALGTAAEGAFLYEIVADEQLDVGAVTFKTPLMDDPGPAGGYLNELPASFSNEYGTHATATAAVTDFETALVARDWATVWTQMDMPSAVDFLLWYDSSGNLDGPRFGSVRICRDKPAGIKAGKLFFVGWDFDATGGWPFDNDFVEGYNNVDQNRFATNRWFSILLEDPDFVAAIIARKSAYSAIFDSWLTKFTQKAGFLDSTGARDRNFALNGDVVFGVPYLYESPGEATTAAHDYWEDRIAIVEADDYTPDEPVEDAFADLILSRSPLAWFRNNALDGDFCEDYSGNGNHGVYEATPLAIFDPNLPTPNPTADVDGISYGLPGPGSDTTVEVTSITAGMRAPSVVIPPSVTAYTVEFWFYPTDIASIGQQNLSVGPYTAGNNLHLGFYAPFSDQNDYLDEGDSEDATNRIGTTGGVVANNAWRHVVGVVNGNVMQLYVNGVLVASRADHVRSVSNIVGLNMAYQRVSSLDPHVKGRYGDIMVYLSALTEAQINENRDARLGI